MRSIRLLAEVGKRKKEKGKRERSFPLFPFSFPPIWSKVFDFCKRSIDRAIALLLILAVGMLALNAGKPEFTRLAIRSVSH